MTIVWRGMTRAELAALTSAMLHSGRILDFTDLPPTRDGPQKFVPSFVDKHSTGGVGDKTSLVVAPLAAAGGLKVPMISGRGLGHTGGTLDKLESIPGFNAHLSLDEFRLVVSQCGCAMIGQTEEIAPADKKLYALRDVTATVESPYLICASVMSKKLAEGIDALVLDVKAGYGAFMKKEADAVFLAELMVETGERMGKKVVALITDMDQPLGRHVGNALEVAEALELLAGGGPDDLRALCIELAAWMFVLGRRAATLAEGKQIAADLIAGGRARDKFREIVAMQGGDPGIVDHPSRLPRARHTAEIAAPRGGFVTGILSEQVGVACALLGGGREKIEGAVDPAAGLVLHKKVGEAVVSGDTLCTLHYNSDARLDQARELLEESFLIGPKPPPWTPLVRRVIGGS